MIGSAWATGECGGRVLRGGSWLDFYPAWVRSADRRGRDAAYRDFDLGFRLAQDLN